MEYATDARGWKDRHVEEVVAEGCQLVKESLPVKEVDDHQDFMKLVDAYLAVSGIRGSYNCGESNRLHKEIEWWLAGKPKPTLEGLGLELEKQ
jgi:hypothetical protein